MPRLPQLPSGEVVPAGDSRALGEKAIDQIGTNEADCTGHEDFLYERNQTNNSFGRGLSESPMQRLQNIMGRKGSGKKLRASIVKYGLSS